MSTPIAPSAATKIGARARSSRLAISLSSIRFGIGYGINGESIRRMADWDLPAAFLDEAAADAQTLGLIVHGSRAVGSARGTSDYDVIRVVTDEEYTRRQDAGALLARSAPDG